MLKHLSVFVIAKDEEADLPGALESVRALAEEIVVVDGGSSDRTREVARRYTDRVFERPFDPARGQGFAEHKQFALDQTTREWALNLDADERLGPGLAEEISERLTRDPARLPCAFSLPFQSYFLGRRLRHGGVGRERHVRLFLKSRAKFNGNRVHEGLEIQGGVERLSRPILHTPYRDLEEYLRKLNLYTSLSARQMREAGRRFRSWHHLIPVWEFARRYLFQLGFLDGRAGLAWAGLSAYYAWVKYLKLSELQRSMRGHD